MDHKEADESSNTVEFSESERERLWRLRREYAEKKHSHMSTDQHRLEFVRWLVATGKLTDQITDSM
jgi:hypothetical protein